MPDPADIFADGLRVYMGAFGCALHFYETTEQEHRQAEGAPLDGVRVATIRVTPEFIKGMVYHLYQRVRQYEQDGAINISGPTLERLTGGDRAPWDRLWEQSQ